MPQKTKPPTVKTSRKHNGSATIHDVARLAGVSPMTVSRVVNGEKSVRPTTRATVMNAVAALNYAPNQAARSLAGSECVRIGLLYSNPSAAYLSEFLVGALDEASRKSSQIVLEKCESAVAAQVAAARKLAQSGVDAVILPPPLGESVMLLDELVENDMPVVVVAAGQTSAKASCVRIDDFAAAREMTLYLLSLGHQRIGFIRGHPNQISSTEREKGFTAALIESGRPVDPAYFAQGYYNFRSGMEGAFHLLSLPEPPSAIFASNDDMAAAAIAAAHRKHLDVPMDLTVVGFDDTAIATTVWPELTTIHQPVAVMAEIALDLAVRSARKRRAGGVPRRIDHLVAYSLIKRESAAPPDV